MTTSATPATPSAAPVYEFEARIRYSEIDHRGRLTLPALIDLFQDASTFQADALGLGMWHLKQERRGWVLTHWQLVIDRMPTYPEVVTVGTFATSFRGLTATRCFYLRDAAGELIVRANSAWAFMDLAAGRPCRPDAEQLAAYGTHEPLDMPAEARRIALPDAAALVAGEPVTVRRHHIDTNEHVNNAQYVAIALDLLPAERAAHRMRVDFKRSAVLGDVIVPALAEEPERTVVVLGNAADPAGTPFAVVELEA